MPRWEFHLSPDDTHTASRWAWMYRYDGGDTITSTGTFGTYDECMIDAVLHGYSAADIGRHREQAQADAALRNTHRSA